ncbi:MAG: tRNA (cytidine(56)-2'-O)-methyltransferase [Candidatus Heimdallarchaeota archaeon]|nr:tRNA (cytidine(56)-2'-O)-methyltransferase [Candidatus Heimdallarchaeota archaeon]
MNLVILRLFHRHMRDKRMTTHIALTARAFGAEELFYTGNHDSSIEESIERITKEWGGNFQINYIENELAFIKKWKKEDGIIVHLTMFGIELEDKLDDLRLKSNNKCLVIVGGTKVPGAIYQLADYNIAIGHQPHSEVAALAVFLDRITKGEARRKKHSDASIEIIPMEIGKNTKQT